MILEHYVWLQQHRAYMYASQFISKEDRLKLYEIYNLLTGENKKPNACGRCLSNTIKRIRYRI